MVPSYTIEKLQLVEWFANNSRISAPISSLCRTAHRRARSSSGVSEASEEFCATRWISWSMITTTTTTTTTTMTTELFATMPRLRCCREREVMYHQVASHVFFCYDPAL